MTESSIKVAAYRTFSFSGRLSGNVLPSRRSRRRPAEQEDGSNGGEGDFAGFAHALKCYTLRRRSAGSTGFREPGYQALRRHAAFVERLEVPAGPPWWTPWHVGMLFAAALAVALLTQLVFFRIQQWKAYTITEERERLAHEIHDTMAQSFAGVGYQIQGIRRSVVRSDRQDSRQIAEQLSVAYQLVRKCHVEASRTIAMLGSASPQIQQNLLGSLAETARRIAGDQIRTVTRLQGNSVSLSLRIADAMLHIGQEAIANAVSHSEPTLLTITLSFEGKDVELAVEDNGQGFDYSPGKAGFGILGMQKRARGVEGTLRISHYVTYKEPLLLFHREDQSFRNVSSEGGAAFHNKFAARGLATGDFNNDGLVDVLITVNDAAPLLLKNNTGAEHRWLGIKLVGRKCNSDAIGARVRYQAGDLIRHRMKTGGGSFLSSHDPRMMLGIGTRQKIDWVEVHWPQPSGAIERFTNLPINR